MPSTLTADQIVAIYPAPNSVTKEQAEVYLPHLVEACREHDITNKNRLAGFLGQLGEESGELVYFEELWGPTEAQLSYEGRVDLGNTEPGDGFFFRGSGPIQITGRGNTTRVCHALGLPVDPDLLRRSKDGFRAAAYFWTNMGNDLHDTSNNGATNLNRFADVGDIEAMTYGVNGGFTNHDNRVRYYRKAMQVLPDDLDLSVGEVAEPQHKALEVFVTSQGWVYEPISTSFCKIGGGPDATYKPDDRGWIYKEGSVAAQPVPDFAWPEANEPAIQGGTFLQRHPIRYTWRSDVEALTRRVLAKFDVSANTYVDHPETFGRTETSVDFWAPEGRGEPIDPAVGQQIFDFIFNDPNPPMIEWCIWEGNIWVHGVGFHPFPDDGTGMHFDHPHFTFF